ncbi:MAG: extracellular solute-binding protein, partial [Dehalococcoidia bacterium]|nr:extracellular solute-binding protein [Dehalococcoidia bacterium]
DIAAPIIAEGGPLKVLTPEDGNSAGLGAVVAMKGAPHPNAARVFVNWLLSQEGQRSYAEAASVTSIRNDVPDFTNPSARVVPKKIWARNWEMEEWARKDLAAKTMEKIFGSK